MDMDDIIPPKNAGFTLIELVAVLLLIGVVIAVVVNRWTVSDTEQTGQIEVIKSHLRYAQSRAMSSSSNWYIHFEKIPAQYTLYKEGDGTKYFPGMTDYNMALASGISPEAAPFIIFDSLGRPYLSNTNTPGTQLAAITTVVSSSAGNITITPETGFIP